jgi:beta-ribofuranosylaminobenzene 5'-phosphate synthase
MSAAQPEDRRGATAVEVRAPARWHLGMMSFGVPGARSFGGVGVMLDRPGVHVRLRRAERFEARGLLAERALRFARECGQVWNPAAACSIDVLAAPRSHVGLGSGTQLGLAVAAGMRHLFQPPAGDEPPAQPHPAEPELRPTDHDWVFETSDALEFARAVGRGRRSCVGVYGFSRGGLIVEAGRVVGEDGQTGGPAASGAAGPTAAVERRSFSPMVARVRLPSAWRCVVILPRDVVGLHGDEEKAAFGRLPPVPTEVSAELARIALLELLPAAVEGDFAAFAAAVGRYGFMAGKPFEQESLRLPHAEATRQLIELLAELGLPGAAQSSWGPAVMACCESLEDAGSLVEQLETLGLAEHHDLVIARFDTQGAVLRVVE